MRPRSLVGLSAALLVVIAAILVRGRLGAGGLPFDPRDVDCIRFRYSCQDTTQIAVRDRAQIDRLLASLRLEPQGGRPVLRARLDADGEVALEVNGDTLWVAVGQHDLYLGGKYGIYYHNSPDFYLLMRAYRDSTHLSEPWIEYARKNPRETYPAARFRGQLARLLRFFTP